MDRYNETALRELPSTELPGPELLGHHPIISEVKVGNVPRPVAQMTEWVLPTHTNAMGTVFGGVVVSWIDIAGVAAAQRYARAPVVTLSIDHLQFMAPIKIGFMVLIRAQVTFVGKTSMEVEVKVEAENTITGHIELAAKGYLTYVALDEEGRPTSVPAFIPQSDEERMKIREAETRRTQRRQWR